MRLLLLFLCLFDEPATIDFPSSEIPPAKPVVQFVETFDTEQLYLIQSESALVIDAVPEGIVNITEVTAGTIIRSRFAGGLQRAETRFVEKPNGYLVEGIAVGEVTLLIRPEPVTRQTQVTRKKLKVIDTVKVDPINVDPPVVKDEIDLLFDQDKADWRNLQRTLSARLKSGDIKSEEDATQWFKTNWYQVRASNWAQLLTKEELAFGVENWTPEKHADYIRRYYDARN